MNETPQGKPLWDPTTRVTAGIIRQWMSQAQQHYQEGALRQAEAAYRKVLGMNQSHAEAHFRLANLLREQGKRDEARGHYETAIALEPVEAHYHLARVLFHEKDTDGAVEHLETVLSRDPNHAQAHRLVGMVYQSTGRTLEAVEHYRTALRLRPDLIAVNLNLGVALQQIGRADDAIRLYRDVLARNPRLGEVHGNLGAALAAAGQYEAALMHYENALETKPGEPLLLYNMGNAYSKLERFDEAIRAYRRALKGNPALVEAHFNLGNAFRETGRLKQAGEAYRAALERYPKHLEARTNLGTVLVRQRRFEEADALYRDAIQRSPEDPTPHWMLGQLLLLQSDFERGWPEFAWVERVEGSDPPPKLAPEWDGGPLTGRRVRVYREPSYGIGDEIMFATCLPELVDEAGECLIEADPRLVPLLRRAMPKALVRAPGQAAAGSEGWHVESSMSAAVRHRRRRLEDFDSRQQCLLPDPVACRRWRERLSGLTGPLKVGIAWHGGSLYRERRERSIDLARWSAVLDTEGVEFVNLQHGAARSQAASYGGRIHDWQEIDPNSRFDDYAALVASLDLVISVDCTTAHLAGALGVKTWVLLANVPNWRWLLDRSSSPWYPGMRLYRQTVPEDWDTVLADVLRDLKDIAARRRQEQGDARSRGAAAVLEQAIAHHTAGELLEAATRYREVIRIDPGNAEAHHNLAGVLQQQGWINDAISELGAALQIRPEYAEAHYNLGNLLRLQDRLSEAVRHYRRAVALQPKFAQAHNNLAGVLKELGELDAAREHYDRALLLDPENNDARFNRATLMMLQGELKGGRREHESRLQRRDLGHRVFPAPFPAWDGSDLSERTVLVCAEQGMGDEVMYASCIPALVERSRRCIVQCDPRLAPLFRRSFPAAEIVGAPREEDRQLLSSLGEVDVHVVAGSLPYHLGLGTPTHPAPVAYLVPEPQQAAVWRERLDGLPQGLNVGISWRSLGDVKERAARTIALERWAPVLSTPGVNFINVQYGPTAQELEAAERAVGVHVHDWDDLDRFNDLEGLAAQLACLDLVITIDNSTAHLAGAVGTPTWILLPLVPDWRWLLGRSETPWYPRTRLIRQQRRGEWSDVIDRTAEVLLGWTHERR
jgi:tetratricopeptide (TPR) repeat protein